MHASHRHASECAVAAHLSRTLLVRILRGRSNPDTSKITIRS